MESENPRLLLSRALLNAPLALTFLFAAGCGGGSSGGSGGGSAPHTVSAVSPPASTTSVPTNTRISASFSGPMNAATITATTFTVTGPGSTQVAGTVAYVEPTSSAIFTASSALTADTTFTATLTTGVRDAAGNALPSDFVWTFTTAGTPDTTRPTVTFSAPASGQTGVSPNGSVTATFSEAMNPASFTSSSFMLVGGGGAVAGTVVYTDSGRVATFNPTQDLLVSTLYTATLTTAVQDLAGNAMVASYVWTFTTGATLDTTSPTVTVLNPADQSTGVSLDKKVNATFSEPLDPTTLTTLTYRLTGPNQTQVPGTIAYDGPSKIATFTPTADLAASTLYTARITSGVKDLSGNALASDRVWTFTTGSTKNTLLPVNLRSAGLFSVLAGSTVTSINFTSVNGDLGLSPGSAVTGFPPGVLNGTSHVTNTTAAAAQLDLTGAYNDAQGRSTNPISLPTDLGGLTLTPGLYKNSTFVQITGTGANGVLTLDAQGDSTAVWIFQTPATLTLGPSTSVVLTGGARATNIFWAVGTSATLDSNSVMHGTILADQAIALKTGATLTGRALARIAAVTLEGNTVTLPSQ